MQNLTLVELVRLTGFLGFLPPRKLVTRSGLRQRGWILTRQQGRVYWESPLERLAIRLALLSSSVRQVISQPITWVVPRSDGDDASFRYTPDLAVAFNDRNESVIVECKPHAHLSDIEVSTRLKRVDELLRRNGSRLVVATERELTPAHEKNVNLIWRHRTWTRSKDELASLILLAQDVAVTKPELRTFIERVGGEHSAFHVIAAGYAFVNWNAPITAQSIVEHNYQEAWDASRYLFARQ